jgi:hypothetical protein
MASPLLPTIGKPSFQPGDHAVYRSAAMLPVLPSVQRLGLAIACTVLLFWLTACSLLAQPPRQSLLQALELQISLTQGDLAQALQLQPPTASPFISRVRLEHQGTTKVLDQKVWQLSGRFDWQLPADRLRVDSPFQVWLLPGEKGQSWRLLRPPSQTDPQWRSYPLPLKGGSVDVTQTAG